MVSIRSLSDFDLQLINLQDLDHQKTFHGGIPGDRLRVQPRQKIYLEIKFIG